MAGTFTGADCRGVDSRAYVVVNGVVQFSDRVVANGATVSFALDGAALQSGGTVDFVVVWNGGVYSEYSWTGLTGAISTQAVTTTTVSTTTTTQPDVGCAPPPSLTEFCGAINATTRLGRKLCEHADWNNDEPLMKRAERDCEVEKGGAGAGRCVPRR